ncbi:DNA translocase FtsK [Halovulum dunhuangense]|uniref:DNA translocase FtsK n=1 Tax=Halovulum dunhuangense TaxID=1505036 RepID=A0A849KV16_9RHOB|nr:DNA translocase FtsK [Halovulum dunhuangense]NNU78875.1 DNA translocase FtsK [Halovulum dunhuangense]
MAQAKARGTRRKQTRTRLLEEKTETALRRRGVEAIGLGLVLLGCLVFAMIWTYDPSDPSLFTATDASPTNALGIVGASIADPLYRAVGLAAFGLPLTLVVWGLRLVAHRGENRILTRLIFSPLAIAVAAIFASAHVPLGPWEHVFGLGGMFGDSLFLTLLGAVPMPVDGALPLVTLVLGGVFLLLSGIALGVDGPESRLILRCLVSGLRNAMAGVMAVLRAVGRLITAAERNRQRRVAAAERAAPREKSEPRVRRGFSRGDSEEARTEPRVVAPDAPDDGSDGDRVMARISAAVRNREAKMQTAQAAMAAAPVPVMAGDLPDPGDEDDVLDYAAPPPPRPEPLVRQTPPRSAPKSEKARREEQPRLALDEGDGDTYQTPPLSLLANPATIVRHQLSNDALEQNARMLETVLDDYGVRGEIVSVRPGPVVTMYELEPAAGLKASRVIGLADDIARSMSALAARVSTIPGRSVIGIELPNEHREKVLLRELLACKAFGDGRHALPLALGKDIAGEPIVANLARMPHLLIAGTTGSGKSVAINTMIMSLLYKLSPDECRLIMIDPKMLELSVYDGIPHLLSPVVTDPKKAVVALKWVVAEMEERYRKMSKMGVRNIDGYNARVQEALDKGEAFTRTVQTGFDDETGEPVFETEEYAPEKMPFIVVIVDEMADLMMVAGKEIEACIQRLAQMARASGIHLIMATQRPSVDVITGTIKANFPTRISFQVTSKIDSRTILGEQGAEQLLGMGDMLYMAGGGRVTRVHGPFVSDEEVEEIVTFLKQQGEPDYVSGVQEGPEADEESQIDMVLGLGGNTSGDDALYDQAVAIVARDRKCSTSYIQRKLGIGYNKAARLVEQMEDEGVVSVANHVGKREVLVPER